MMSDAVGGTKRLRAFSSFSVNVKVAMQFARRAGGSSETGHGRLWVVAGSGGRDVTRTNPYGEPEVIVLPDVDLAVSPQNFTAEERRRIEDVMKVSLGGVGVVVMEGPSAGREAARRRLCGLLDRFVDEQAQRAAAENATAVDWYNLGVMCRARGDYDGAVEAYQHALQLDPSHVDALHSLAVLLTEHYGWHDEARRMFEHCLTLRPDDANTHQCMAILLGRVYGEHEAARRHYQRAIELDPSDALNRLSYAQFLYDDVKAWEEALAAVDAAIERDQNLCHAHSLRARILKNERGEYLEARREYEKALAIDPNDAVVHRNLAVLLGNELHDYAAAAKHLRIAARLYAERRQHEEARYCQEMAQ